MNIKLSKAHKLSRRMYFRGLHISVETDKGELRHWYDPHNEEKGTTKMKYPYGYIRRTKGVDGDHVDVYVGPNERAKNVYIVHQMKAPNFDKYDEDKCMLGFLSAESAKAAYLRHYNDRRFFGSMTTIPFEDFEEKVLKSFDLKRPRKITVTTKAAGTSLKFIQQLERDFGPQFAQRFFKETTQAAKGLSRSAPQTAIISPQGVKKMALPPPLPQELQAAGAQSARDVLGLGKAAAAPAPDKKPDILGALLDKAEGAGKTVADYARKGYGKAEQGARSALHSLGLAKKPKTKEAVSLKALLAGAGLLGGGAALAAGAGGDGKKSVADIVQSGLTGGRTQRGLEQAGIGGF